MCMDWANPGPGGMILAHYCPGWHPWPSPGYGHAMAGPGLTGAGMGLARPGPGLVCYLGCLYEPKMYLDIDTI